MKRRPDSLGQTSSTLTRRIELALPQNAETLYIANLPLQGTFRLPHPSVGGFGGEVFSFCKEGVSALPSFNRYGVRCPWVSAQIVNPGLERIEGDGSQDR